MKYSQGPQRVFAHPAFSAWAYRDLILEPTSISYHRVLIGT